LSELKDFLSNESDFAFEMRVLHKLRTLEFECEHGGTYEDPITQKRRQFDIRAKLVREIYDLRLAVECKNLRESSPLLVHAVKRRVDEAFHHLVVHPTREQWRIVPVESYESTYEPGQFVGKSTDQVARKDDGEFKRSDAEAFDKMMQAVNSAGDAVESAVRVGRALDTIISIIPMLVLPDGMLWQVDYADDGKQIGEPKQVDYCPFFINHPWQVVREASPPYAPYRLSHLEIVTFSGVMTRAASHLLAQAPGQPKGVFALYDAVLRRPPLPRG